MKSKILSLAVLMLAGVASGALAQEEGRPHGDRSGPRNGGFMYNAARRAQEQAPQAPAPPRATQAQSPPAAQPGPRPLPRGPAQIEGRDRGGWNRPDRGPQARPEGERRRDGERDRRWGEGRGDQSWRDHRGDHERWRDQHRRQEWSRGRGEGPRWTPHTYPPIYSSPRRYRYAGPLWSPPYGYYAHSWRFDEILPRGWYEPEHRILDWWAYGLPEPPAGYDWVRVGSDAVLVDLYSGRIVQVVRLLFY